MLNFNYLSALTVQIDNRTYIVYNFVYSITNEEFALYKYLLIIIIIIIIIIIVIIIIIELRQIVLANQCWLVLIGLTKLSESQR